MLVLAFASLLLTKEMLYLKFILGRIQVNSQWLKMIKALVLLLQKKITCISEYVQIFEEDSCVGG
jgi:hypothetical protein